MSLWTLTPLVAVVLLGAHPGPAVSQGPVLAAATQPAPSSVSLAAVSPGTSPVLQQLDDGDWKTTVLVTGASSGCPTTKGDYWLNTTSPDMTIQPTGNAAPVGNEGGASCEITLTFSGTKIGVPATATLVIDGTSALPLAIGRNITFWGYIGVPLLAGTAMAIFLLFLSLVCIRVYNRDAVAQRPFGKKQANVRKRLQKHVNKGFWQHEVYASGAWTLNDSWATNISTALAVIATVIGIVPATEVFFHGIALDRFSILSAVAAGIATAAPLVIAVRYARWTRLHPGVTDDAELSLPEAARPDSSVWLDGSLPLIVTSGTLIAVEQEDLREPDPPDEKKPEPHQKVRAQLAESAVAKLTNPAPVKVTPTGGEWVVLPPAAEPPTVELPGGTEVILASGQRTELRQLAEVGLPAGAAARIPVVGWDVLLAVVRAEAEEDQNGAEADGEPLGSESATEIDAPSGATVIVSWGATVCDQDSASPRAAHVQADSKIQVPPDSTIRVIAERITLPGGSDLMVRGTSVLRVTGRDPNPDGTLCIPGSDITLPKDALADDIQLSFPVFITPPFGAKITVNGVAEVTVPEGTLVQTRYRNDFHLSPERSHSRLPAGPNSLAGTMGMILLAGLVTMFGIGMQIGVAAVLVGLSEATLWAQAIMWVLLLFVVAFTLHYSVTAIREMADPEPGSTMSTTAGTSFTL
jgi:hypothetical protein